MLKIILIIKITIMIKSTLLRLKIIIIKQLIIKLTITIIAIFQKILKEKKHLIFAHHKKTMQKGAKENLNDKSFDAITASVV